MLIKHYLQIAPQVWDDFVYSSKMGHSYFSYEMTSLPPPRVYPNRTAQNMSFGVFDEKNELILIFQLFLWRHQSFLSKFFHLKEKLSLSSFHGLCIKDNLPNKTSKKLKSVLENYLDDFFINFSCKELECDLPSFCDLLRPDASPIECNPLINYNFIPQIRYTYIIDLFQKEQDILNNYLPTTRNIIARASKENNIAWFETNGSDNDFNELIKLNNICYESQDSKHKLTNDYLCSLWNIIKQKKLCRCFFLKEDNIISCYVILLYYKDSVYYFWGGGIHNSQNIQRYLLHTLIFLCKEEGYKWFDIGSAYPWLRNGKRKSISDFKKSFSHKLHPVHGGVYVPLK